MRYGTTFTLLLLTAGLSLMPTGSLLADDAASRSGCNHRLIGIEQRLGDAGRATASAALTSPTRSTAC
jgi:hypothetical protein